VSFLPAPLVLDESSSSPPLVTLSSSVVPEVVVLEVVLVLVVDEDVLVASFFAAAALAAFSCPPAVALAAVAESDPVPEAMEAVIKCPSASIPPVKRRRYVLRSGSSPWADECSKEQIMTAATTNDRVRLMIDFDLAGFRG